MKSNFNDCLTRLLKDEGGYSNDPSDSGGPTNYGITLADYQKYINRQGTASDVKGMSIDDAKTIYKTKYWDALMVTILPVVLTILVSITASILDWADLAKALAKFKDKKGTELIDAINDERVDFLHAISGGKNAKFLKGWLARVSRVRDYSKTLARKNNAIGPAAAVITVGATAGSSYTSFWQGHQTLIIAGGIAAAVMIGFLVHYIKIGTSNGRLSYSA